MMFKNIEGKIKERWIKEICLMLMFVGIFEFIYIWFNRFTMEGYSKFCGYYDFGHFLVSFIQVYSVLFIPILCYLGFKYRYSVKFNSKKSKIIINLIVIIALMISIYFYHPLGLWEWVFMIIPIFVLISFRFNCIFALAFSYLSFFSANMLFEIQGLSFLKSFSTVLAYITVFGLMVYLCYKLKIRIDKYIIGGFIPIVIYWLLFFNIYQLKGIEFSLAYMPYDNYSRLFMFPFFIIIALKIYFDGRKVEKL